MKYCSSCGAPVIRRLVAADGRERLVCTSCATTHYENPRVIVGCVACWRDTILLCRRGQDPAVGKWMIPSGFLECGETLEEGAARETLEETGVKINPADLELYTVANMTAIDQIAVSFRIQLTDLPIVRPGPECLEAAFVAESEIPLASLAWHDAMGSRPRRFFSELRSGAFTVQLMTVGAGHGAGFRSREYKIQSASNAD